MVSCNKFLVDDAQKRLEENEQEIQSYIQSSKISFQKTTSGLYYSQQSTNPNGVKPAFGNQVAMHYTLFTFKGTKLDSTERLKNKPYTFIYGIQRLIPGMEEALTVMKSGEKALILMNHTLAFGSQSDNILPAFSAVAANIEVVSVLNEEQQIDDYVKSKNLTLTEKTTSGLRFIRTVTTTNAQVMTGETVKVKYTGKLLNDTQFDAGELPQVRVNGGNYIKGFDEGIAKLRLGEKAILIFPSSLGYGQSGSGKILPFSPLVFEIEVNK